MSYNEVIQIEIECDFPGCDEYILFSNEGWKKINQMIKAIGWTELSFPGDEDRWNKVHLDFCSNCKSKDIPTKEAHDCIYIRKTKKGTTSEYGSVLECVFCEKLKGSS